MSRMDTDSYAAAYNAAVAAELRAERAARQMTVEELAQSAGMVKGTLLRYLNAQRPIPIPALYSICIALKVDAGKILDRGLVRLEREKNH